MLSRIPNDTGWRPRPVREALHAYGLAHVAERAASQ